MFKPELWQDHDGYRTLVTTVGCRLSRNNPKYSFDLYKEERDKLLNLDPDPFLDLIPAYYPDGGRSAEHQAQLFRPLVLFVLLLNETRAGTSLTSRARESFPHPFPSPSLPAAHPPTDCRQEWKKLIKLSAMTENRAME